MTKYNDDDNVNNVNDDTDGDNFDHENDDDDNYDDGDGIHDRRNECDACKSNVEDDCYDNSDPQLGTKHNISLSVGFLKNQILPMSAAILMTKN